MTSFFFSSSPGVEQESTGLVEFDNRHSLFLFRGPEGVTMNDIAGYTYTYRGDPLIEHIIDRPVSGSLEKHSRALNPDRPEDYRTPRLRSPSEEPV